MKLIHNELYQASNYVTHDNQSFNQYLLLTKEPILFYAGDIEQAALLIPKIKETLGDRELSYIFSSYFEPDECRGVSMILTEYPNAKVIYQDIIKAPGETLTGDDYELEFIAYPSEIHECEGLLAFEKKRKVLFSSDLFLSYGDSRLKTEVSTWQEEIEKINSKHIPGEEERKELINELEKINPVFIATNHGMCIDIKEE